MATTQLIEVTSAAAEKLSDIIEEQGETGSLLRVMVVPGEHGGMQYMLGLEKEAKDGDFVIDTDTVQVLIDSDSAPLIEGAQIDYVDSLMRSGFVISNPNSMGGCGCGGGGCGCGGGGGGCGGGGGGCACGGGGCGGACGGH